MNLASRPTRNQRRFYVLAGTGVAILLALALGQVSWFVADWWRGRDLVRQTERLRAETERLAAEQQRLESELKQPQARDVIDRSYFLNSLIVQKGVSWTQIFMDLEKLVPDRVFVTSIRPQVLENNQIRLEMLVTGESINHLLGFLRRIESSDKFGMPVLGSERPATAQDSSTQLTLTVLYVQK